MCAVCGVVSNGEGGQGVSCLVRCARESRVYRGRGRARCPPYHRQDAGATDSVELRMRGITDSGVMVATIAIVAEFAIGPF